MGFFETIKEITWLTALVLLAMVAFNGPMQSNSSGTLQVDKALTEISEQVEAGTIAIFDTEELVVPEPLTQPVKIAVNFEQNDLNIH